MNEKSIMIAGMGIFLIAVTFPFWYAKTIGTSALRPELTYPVGESGCVEDVEYMRGNHMKLLHQWRDEVVREGKDIYLSQKDGKAYKMSLTRTCLNCHTNRAAFCGKCHTYADVQPACWQCHNVP